MTNVEQHPVGEGKVGPITQKLREGFICLMEQECGRTQ